MDDALAIVKAIARPQVKIVLDTYHLGFDRDLLRYIPQVAPHLALVQLGDGKGAPQGEQNRCRLGDGAVPLKQIVDALKAAGYDGYYDVELLGEEIEAVDYQTLLRHAKDMYRCLVIE
jgi:sugar phosphate isomerase/epimerase